MEGTPLKKEHLMKIGEVASKAGTSVRTVRYYEELGMLSPTGRSKGRFRLYSEDELQKVLLIKAFQLLGFSLERIRGILKVRKLSKTGKEAAPKTLEILEDQLLETLQKMAKYDHLKKEIQQAMEIIKGCLGCDKEPLKDTCLSCDNLAGREEVPLPLKAIL